MRCPGCNEEMREFDQGGVVVDLCSGCRGLWFDLGELERMLGAHPRWAAAATPGGVRSCPRCPGGGSALERRSLAQNLDLGLDLCRRCGGVFVEAGGLPALRSEVRSAVGATGAERQAQQEEELLGAVRREKERREMLWPRVSGSRTTSAQHSWLTWFAWMFDVPLEVDPVGRRDPWMTLTLLTSLVLVFLWQLWAGLEATVDSWGLVPEAVRSGSGYATIVTSVWLHGGWHHLIVNGFCLWLFGDDVEEVVGRWRFLAWFLLCGIVGSLTSVILAPDSAAGLPSVGASSAVLGVAVAYAIWFPRERLAIPWLGLGWVGTLLQLPAWGWLLLVLAAQVFGLLTGQEGVAWWDHLGGMAAGLLGALLWRPARASLRR